MKNNQNGFTLVELMISLGIGSFLMLATSSLFLLSQNATVRVTKNSGKDFVLARANAALKNPTALRNMLSTPGINPGLQNCVTGGTGSLANCIPNIDQPLEIRDASIANNTIIPSSGLLAVNEFNGSSSIIAKFQVHCPSNPCTSYPDLLYVTYNITYTPQFAQTPILSNSYAVVVSALMTQNYANTTETYTCTAGYVSGINTDGSPICTPFPNCPQGQVMTAITTSTITCSVVKPNFITATGCSPIGAPAAPPSWTLNYSQAISQFSLGDTWCTAF